MGLSYLVIAFFKAVLAFAVGFGIGTICLVQSLVIIFFAFRFTATLISHGAIKTYAPFRHYSLSLALLLGIFSLSTWLAWQFFNAIFTPYLIGAIVPAIFGIKFCGLSSDNITDYLNTNAKRIDLGWLRQTGGSEWEEKLRMLVLSHMATEAQQRVPADGPRAARSARR